jgi:hypothetical protein
MKNFFEGDMPKVGEVTHHKQIAQMKLSMKEEGLEQFKQAQ